MNTFSDHCRKPPFTDISWPLEGQNFANMSESFLNTHLTSVHHKFELDCVNAFSDNGRKPPFWPIFWPVEGQNGQCGPKVNKFWTLTYQMHTLNLKLIGWWLFQIMVGNPGQTDTQTHGRTDTWTLTISRSPLDFAGGDKNIQSLHGTFNFLQNTHNRHLQLAHVQFGESMSCVWSMLQNLIVAVF